MRGIIAPLEKKWRIRKAKELVDQGNTNAATIAKAVGFNDPTYFKSVYLRYTGSAFPVKAMHG